MPTFSRASVERLETCHPDLQRLFHLVVAERDCTILCGHRGREEQEKAFRDGHSKARWGQSNHNFSPSLAVDVMPYPIDWSDRVGLEAFAAFVKAKAVELGLSIRWGGEFSGFFDGPHYELVGYEGTLP